MHPVVIADRALSVVDLVPTSVRAATPRLMVLALIAATNRKHTEIELV